MANIITTIGAAGSTGKTTVTVNLATVLAYIYRLRVLCINLDAPSSFSLWFELEKPQQPPPISRPLHDYPINLHDIKEQTRNIAAALYIVNDWDGKESFFNETIDLVRNEFDYILIDTARSFNVATLRACAVADLVIISGGLNINEAHHLDKLDKMVKQTQADFQRPSQHVRLLIVPHETCRSLKASALG